MQKAKSEGLVLKKKKKKKKKQGRKRKKKKSKRSQTPCKINVTPYPTFTSFPLSHPSYSMYDRNSLC